MKPFKVFCVSDTFILLTHRVLTKNRMITNSKLLITKVEMHKFIVYKVILIDYLWFAKSLTRTSVQFNLISRGPQVNGKIVEYVCHRFFKKITRKTSQIAKHL